MSATRVVVTGLGTTSPVGGDVPTTWAALLAGQSGVRPLTEDWAEQLPVKIAARVAVEPTEVLERVKARRLDRTAPVRAGRRHGGLGRLRPGPGAERRPRAARRRDGHRHRRRADAARPATTSSRRRARAGSPRWRSRC